jgi:hypothetical protein
MLDSWTQDSAHQEQIKNNHAWDENNPMQSKPPIVQAGLFDLTQHDRHGDPV